MSKGNPRKAVAALLPSPISTAEGLVVKPMTLAMWAALERIQSPLVTGSKAPDAMSLIPSLYLLANGAEKIFEPQLMDKAFAWADRRSVTALAELREACEL